MRARNVLQTGEPAMMSFDTRRRFGCNGKIDIFIERASQNFFGDLSNNLDARHSCLVVTTEQGSLVFVGEAINSPYKHKDGTLLIQQICPPIRLLIFGDGPDNAPIRKLSELLGWETIEIVDPNAISIETDEWTVALVKSHNYGRDVVALQKLLPLNLRYVGLIGPRKRRDQLLNDLLDFGIAINAGFFAPAGLDLGAETSEEIALAIVSEIQRVLADRSGFSLRERKMAIHRALECAGTLALSIGDMSPQSQSQIGAVILAAGESSRFGQPKQLIQFRGKSLVRRIVDAAKKARCSPIAVVVGNDRIIPRAGPLAFRRGQAIKSEGALVEAIARELDNTGAAIVKNKDWRGGVGTSIRAGARHLMDQSPEVDAIMLLVCDQPAVDARAIERLIKLRETTKNSIVASSYADTLGVPALFDRSLFQELLSLGDKAGAKSVIFRNRERVAEFVFPEGKIDIDTREDWQKLKERGHPYHPDAGEGSHTS
jgi:CTP:molybdopterin cytidylyltransferase MocA/xanthine/CO dehydrogenase XdhC/CoxF family maturation factor